MIEKRAEEALPDEIVELEEAVTMALAACGGNPRSAVRALLTANTNLHHEVERLQSLVSPGTLAAKQASRRPRVEVERLV